MATADVVELTERFHRSSNLHRVNHHFSTPESNAQLGEILISQKELQDRVAELGAQITADYEGKAPLLITVLKGAALFFGDLSRAIRLPVEFDFMAVASYGSATKTSGVVRIIKDLDADLERRDVIIVEDVVDSGLTLNFLRKNLLARNPASLEVCSLLFKTGVQKTNADTKYVGFEMPPDFVVGYGLDFDQKYRNLPYICRFNQE